MKANRLLIHAAVKYAAAYMEACRECDDSVRDTNSEAYAACVSYAAGEISDVLEGDMLAVITNLEWYGSEIETETRANTAAREAYENLLVVAQKSGCFVAE